MGCVASISSTATSADSPAGATQALAFKKDSFNDAGRSPDTYERTDDQFTQPASKYTPRDDGNRGSVSAGVLLAMAMEVTEKKPIGASAAMDDSAPRRGRAQLRTGVDPFDHEDHSHGNPDLAFSIRARGQEKREENTIDTKASLVANNAAAVSRGNVATNRPSVQHLNGSNVNTDFQDHLGKGHTFVPMQAGGVPFVPMQVAPVGLPVGAHIHPLASMGGHAHGPYHLTPLDQVPGGQSFREFGFPAVGFAGRGRGSGLPSVVVGPNATLMAGGFRAQPLPVGATGKLGGGGRGPASGMMGRGRGQPLQITIPGKDESLRGGSSRLPAEFSAQGHRTPEGAPTIASIQPTTDSKNSDDDDDDENDDLVDDSEGVEDWGLEEEASAPPQAATMHLSPPKTSETTEEVQHGPTRAPPMISPQPKPSDATRPTKKFRPGMEISDDAIQQVDPDSNDDDDDDSDDDASGDGDGELSDWLDTSPNPKQLIQKTSATSLSPAKLSGRQEIVSSRQPGASTPQGGSPTTYGLVPASPSPTQRAAFGAHGSSNSPHPPLASQQASMRQLGAFGGTGNISPTRPAGPPPNSGSPVKIPSYRSNIVTSGLPVIMPLSAVGSPMTAPTDTNGAAIRDTKVVKKKKAELPQVNLPHPVPKFGDWLNSRTMINNYIILETLGAGSYAEVKLCKEKVSGKLFAMKFINRDVMKKDKLGKQSKLDDIKREIAIMKKLNHPNVLRLYEVMDDPSMNKLFLVLEYMKHGDLMGHQKKKHPNGASENLHDRDLHCVLLQVILGLAYLHEQKIVHGDIKPQNLLVGDKDVVKIADFGISQSLYGSKQKLSDTAGTPAFMSPEMCSGQEYSGQLADIWAVGATVFMLKFGNPPFVAKSAMQMFEKIQNDPLVFPGPIDPLLEDLLRGMLTKNPIKRMTLLQIMTHPWVTKEEHPSHFVLKDKTPQITVTNEEIDNAIDASDKFAIIVNIRVQMMKKLQKARHEILTQRQASRTEDGAVHGHKMLVADVAALTAADTASPSALAAHAPKTSSRSSGKNKSNKVFVDSPQGSSRSHHADEKDHKMLTSEEIHYRSQLFSRKKVSGVATSNGASSAALSKTMEHDEHRFHDLVAASSSAAVGEDAESNADDEDALSEDDDDEMAVSQSPQLLDELLLMTLSMPPLTKGAHPPTSSLDAHKLASTATAAPSVTALSLPSLQTKSASEPADSQWFYAENSGLRVSIGVASLQGRRNTQEDRWTVLPNVDVALSSRWATSLFAGLYDGHGGEDCANILQEQLHAWLFRAPDEHFASTERLQQCFVEFDTFLCDYLFHKGDLSGSTATCVLVDPTKSNPALAQWKLLVGHVGDCRLVLARRNGETVDVTNDHRLTLQAERERVLQLGGRVVNNRVNGVMAITRAFGDLEFKGLMGKRNSSSMALIPEAVQPSPFQGDDERTPALLTAQPDIHFVSIDGAQDEFLLLACDGLWDVMTSEEATEILRDRYGFHGNVQLAAKELAQEGIRRYSNDNISVIVLHFPTPT